LTFVRSSGLARALARNLPGRLADTLPTIDRVRTMFITYLVLIIAGVVCYTVIGIAHH